MQRSPFILFVLASVAVIGIAVAPARAEFAICDGDTVVFLGDSITAARQYSKVIEQYTLLRFPERKVKFINAGKGGETVRLALGRLDDAVFANGATVVTVAYGVNDIGWGARADAAHKQDYLDAVAELVDRCQKRNVRVFLCSAAITSEDPDRAENGFLTKMCDEGIAIAKSKGAGAIDVQRAMRRVQRRALATKPVASLHAPDGIHLNDLGQVAMGWAILKGLGAPAEVSSATIDAAGAKLVNAVDCDVTDVSRTNDGLSFTRLDARLPLNVAPLWMLHGILVPIADELNRYMLTVTGLPDAKYELLAGGRLLGTWSAAQLAAGVNIASASADAWRPGGPWDAQAQALNVFTTMRDEIVFARRGINADLGEHPGVGSLREQTESIERGLVQLQRDVARPVPVRFTIREDVKAKSISFSDFRGESLVLAGETPGKLLGKGIDPGSIVVRSTYVPGLDGTVVYEPARDYRFDAKTETISRVPGSRIPDFATNILYGKRDFDHSKFPGYGNIKFFVYVDYRFAEPVTLATTHDESAPLAKTVAKLKAGEPVKMIAFGDSITAGGEASTVDLQYPARFLEEIRRRYPAAKISWENGSTGGDNTVMGLARLNDKVLTRSPDLVLVAFGMNDNNLANVGGVAPAQFKENLKQIVTQIREKTGAEVILLSTFPPHPEWHFASHTMDKLAQVTKVAAEEMKVAYADVFSVWQTVLARKDPSSVIANNINHPNDFGHWLYLVALQAMKF